MGQLTPTKKRVEKEPSVTSQLLSILFIWPVPYLSSIDDEHLLSEGSVSSRHRQAGWSDGQEVKGRTRFVSAVRERVMPHQSTGTTQHDALKQQQEEANQRLDGLYGRFIQTQLQSKERQYL